MLQFEFITTKSQYLDLVSAWETLSRESTPYQFFQDWYWIHSWWENFAASGNYQLKILVATLDNNVIMIWPWVVKQKYGLQILEPMGGLFSCFDDALIMAANENQSVLRQAWKFIVQKAEVDAIELRAVHKHAAIAPLMSEVGGDPINITSAPVVDIQAYDSFESYLAGRTKKMRQNQRRSIKYLSKQGTLKGNGNDEEFPVDLAIDTCLSFKTQWLTARGLSGKTLVTNEATVFMKDICNYYRQHPTTADLCISSLKLDDKPISIGIGFRYHNYHYEYLGGFDYQLERFGPGRLRMEYGMRDCFEKGIDAYNMLTPATSFKKIWTEDNPVVKQFIIPTTVKGRVYRDIYMRKLRPQLKRAYNIMPSTFRTKLFPNKLWG
jgi:CelD/BcsL family acetyltransferase involved in cellulose biosynthesis